MLIVLVGGSYIVKSRILFYPMTVPSLTNFYDVFIKAIILSDPKLAP